MGNAAHQNGEENATDWIRLTAVSVDQWDQKPAAPSGVTARRRADHRFDTSPNACAARCGIDVSTYG